MRIALCQLNSKLDFRHNLDQIKELLEEAKKQKAVAAFLPECFYSMSDGVNPTPHLVEDHSEHLANIKSLAVDYGLALIGGSVAYRLGNQIVNRALNISKDGVVMNSYDKINLFACDLYEESRIVKKIRESNIYTPGTDLNFFNFGTTKIGNAICFDLRFPEIFSAMIKENVDIVTVPSAFTRKTGEIHWHLLNRARAIETQAFIISAAQVGEHNAQVRTYGHSLVVDPWGEILLDLGGKKSSVGFVDLNFDKIKSARNSIKVR